MADHPRQPDLHDDVMDGIVLAAGRSERMRRPKALLRVDGETFIERTIHVLQEGGCRGVIVVVGTETDGDVVRLAEQSAAKVVVNRETDTEQIDSLRLGLSALEDGATAAVVLPVDHPLVEAATISALLAEFRSRRAPIVRPVYRGAPGHPTVFAREIFREFYRPDLPHGAQSVVSAHESEIVDVPVDDPGVIADIDTPDDYRRFITGAC